MNFDIKSEQLLALIEEEIKELQDAYGRRLLGRSISNPHVKQAVGQMEAYMRVKILIKRLACPTFEGEKHA
jgi:hypothetical protein